MLKKLILIGSVLTLFLGGCAWKEANRNLQNAEKLRLGMNKTEVLAIMGEPQQNEVYVKPNLWFYYTSPNWIDGLATEDECMPLLFEDGKLVGWGNEFYATHRLKTEKKEEEKK